MSASRIQIVSVVFVVFILSGLFVRSKYRNNVPDMASVSVEPNTIFSTEECETNIKDIFEPLTGKISFVHIPKVAGTSLARDMEKYNKDLWKTIQCNEQPGTVLPNLQIRNVHNIPLVQN